MTETRPSLGEQPRSKSGPVDVTFQEVSQFLGDVTFDIDRYDELHPCQEAIEQRSNFLKALPDTIEFWRSEDGPLNFNLQKAMFTFDFEDRLTKNEAITAILRMRGLHSNEIEQGFGRGSSSRAATKAYDRVRRNLAAPSKVNLTLFSLAKGYLSFDTARPTRLRDPDLTRTSVSLIAHLAESNGQPRTLSRKFTRPVMAGVVLSTLAKEAYNNIGVTNHAEAVLSLATHGLIHPPKEYFEL